MHLCFLLHLIIYWITSYNFNPSLHFLTKVWHQWILPLPPTKPMDVKKTKQAENACQLRLCHANHDVPTHGLDLMCTPDI
jgi:hypothetical protein